MGLFYLWWLMINNEFNISYGIFAVLPGFRNAVTFRTQNQKTFLDSMRYYGMNLTWFCIFPRPKLYDKIKIKMSLQSAIASCSSELSFETKLANRKSVLKIVSNFILFSFSKKNLISMHFQKIWNSLECKTALRG